MKKKLYDYIAYLETLDFSDMTTEQKNKTKANLLTQIGFYQHERLIHLIVTVLFAILTVLMVFGCLAWPSITMFILTVLIISLLIPYLGHYYYLENGVQKLYDYYLLL